MASNPSPTAASGTSEQAPRLYYYRDRLHRVALVDELPSWVMRWQIDWICQPGNLEHALLVIVADNGNIAACETMRVARDVVYRWKAEGTKDLRWAICRVAPKGQW